MSLNEATLIGNLGSDPDIRALGTGKQAILSIATSERWKDAKTGEPKEKTEWHRVIIWNEHLIPVAEKYLRKGSKVFIRGKLQTREWEDKGVRRFTTEIVLGPYNATLQLLDKPPAREEAPQAEGAA
jgi:single-strand DNA-binding protein